MYIKSMSSSSSTMLNHHPVVSYRNTTCRTLLLLLFLFLSLLLVLSTTDTMLTVVDAITATTTTPSVLVSSNLHTPSSSSSSSSPSSFSGWNEWGTKQHESSPTTTTTVVPIILRNNNDDASTIMPNSNSGSIPSSTIITTTTGSSFPSIIPNLSLLLPTDTSSSVVPINSSSSDVPTGSSISSSDSPSSFPTGSSLPSHSLSSDASSSLPSDVPSSLPSDVPSSLPSDAPSDLLSSFPSNVPSSLQSDIPSDGSSSIPTIERTDTFNEDAVQLGLEALDLVGYSNIQSWSKNGNEPNILIDSNNNKEYELDNLLPYTELFDPAYFHMDGFTITNRRSNENFIIPIYRSSPTDDGTIVQFATNEMGNITFAEIRVTDPSINDDIFYIPSDILRASNSIGEDSTNSTTVDVLISFTSSDLDNDKFGTIFNLDEVELPFVGYDVLTNTTTTTSDNPSRRLRRVRRTLDESTLTESNSSSSTNNNNGNDGNTAASICSQYQIVKLAIVYDSSLCNAYGSMAATRNRVISIVASASLYYEREICVKLQLVDIYTPDTSCSSNSGTNSFTNQFNTESACRGDSNLLSDFTDWIRERRNSIGIDRNAIIHLFTGADKVTSTIGCAFTSSYCSGFPYGVEYATFSSNLLAQAVVFAHEVAHNLGAPHIADNSNRFDYIMEASISSGSDGFGSTSSNTIRNYLSRVTCDTVQPSGGNPPTNSPPRPSPIAPVPIRPSSPTPPTIINGCPTVPEISAPNCISIGNVASNIGYACYSLNQLLPEDCDNVRWSIATCDGITIRNSPRSLVSSGVNDTTISFGEDEADVDDFIQEDQSSSLIFNPASGSSTSCSTSCVFSTNNRICLLASASNNKHSISYRAINRNTGTVIRTLERTIPIVNKNSNSNNVCRPANLRCQ